jgi:hypothetical protein
VTGEECGSGTLDVYSRDERCRYDPERRFCLFRCSTPISVTARLTGLGLASSPASSGSSVCARRERRSEVPERGSLEMSWIGVVSTLLGSWRLFLLKPSWAGLLALGGVPNMLARRASMRSSARLGTARDASEPGAMEGSLLEARLAARTMLLRFVTGAGRPWLLLIGMPLLVPGREDGSMLRSMGLIL